MKPNTKKILKLLTHKKSQKHYLIAAGSFFVLFLIIIFGLKLYTAHGRSLSVPDLTGFTIAEALQKSEEKNLRLEVIDSVYEGTGKRGSVIDQNPPPNFKVKSGRKIFVTIKSVNPRMIQMPNLVHATLVQAKANIRTYGLRIEKLSYQPSIYDNVVLEQKFNDQKIKPGTVLAAGSGIELVLGKSSDMNSSKAPDLIGLTLENAEFEAAQFMLNIGDISYTSEVKTYEDTVSAEVVEQNPPANASAQPGSSIDVRLGFLPDEIDSTDSF